MEDDKVLLKIIGFFDKENIHYWIDHGTLLGIYRDGKLIEWDNDIDISLHKNEWDDISKRLDNLKFTNYHIRKSWRVIKLIPNNKKLRKIDISYYYYKNDKYIKRFGGRAIEVNYYRKVLLYIIEKLSRLNKKTLRSNFFARILKTLKGYSSPTVKSKVPKRFFEQFSFIEYLNKKIRIPNDVEGYLKFRYGKDWKSPVKEWNHIYDDNTI